MRPYIYGRQASQLGMNENPYQSQHARAEWQRGFDKHQAEVQHVLDKPHLYDFHEEPEELDLHPLIHRINMTGCLEPCD